VFLGIGLHPKTSDSATLV